MALILLFVFLELPESRTVTLKKNKTYTQCAELVVGEKTVSPIAKLKKTFRRFSTKL